MLWMILVGLECGSRFEGGVQHDVIGALEPRLGKRNLEAEHAGDDAIAGLKQCFHLGRIACFVGTLGMIFQLPHHDMLDHRILRYR